VCGDRGARIGLRLGRGRDAFHELLHPRKERLTLEGLRDVAVGPHGARARLVEGLERACE
jgi:hypothetical protein